MRSPPTPAETARYREASCSAGGAATVYGSHGTGPRPWEHPRRWRPSSFIPGFMGGANSFDYIGRQLVSMAEADAGVGSLEVWAMERRTNCLEDLTGMNAAEAAGDPGIAVDYYYHGVEVDEKVFRGSSVNRMCPSCPSSA